MERLIKMDMPDEKGNSYRRRLEIGKQKYGLDSPDLNPELDLEFPPELHRALSAWNILSSTRHELNAVTLGEIKTYCELYGMYLTSVEVECILLLDRCFIKYVMQAQKNKG